MKTTGLRLRRPQQLLIALFIAISFVIAGCGGGSSPTSVAVSGTTFKGPTVGAIITVFEINADGTPGAQVDIGTSPVVTGADGSWNVTMPAGSSGKYIVVSTGGTYLDEATGQTVNAGTMRGILDLSSGTTAPITPLTDAMVQTVQNNAVLAGGVDNALATVQADFDAAFGFDPLSTLPATGPDFSGSADQQAYSLVLAGLSQQATPHAQASDTFDDTMALANALVDGIDTQEVNDLNASITNYKSTLADSNPLKTLSVQVDDPNTHSVSAVVSGLNGGTLILQNNAADDLTITTNASHAFSVSVDDNSAYAVSVKSQPDGQTCTITGGSGTATSDVTAIVECADNPPPSYTVSASVTGLSGTLVLQNNGTDDLTVTSDGTHAFSQAVNEGTASTVTVKTQPTGQTCEVFSGSKTLVPNVIVSVRCSDNPPVTHTLSAAVSGLTGTLVLQNNGGDDLTFTSDTTQSFSQSVADGTSYAVTVITQPAGQTCNVTSGSGTATSNTTVAVQCTDDPAITYTISAVVQGLSGTLVLQNNGADDLTVTTNATHAFSQAVNDGGSYSVSIVTQPAGQSCSVLNGSGTASANVTVTVRCSDAPPANYTVTAVVSGLTGTLVLQNNGTNDLSITADGPHSFSQTLTDKATYAVTVKTQPQGQICSVTNGSGTINAADVSNVQISCANDGAGSNSAASYCPSPGPAIPPDLNGWSWVNRTPVGADLLSVAEGNGVYVAVGEAGVIVRSTDRITWTEVNSGYPNDIQKVYWDGSAFVAITKKQNSTYSNNNGTFTVTSHPNEILISCDGITWVKKEISVTADASATAFSKPSDLKDIVRVDGKYFATNASIFIYYSDDAVNWTATLPIALPDSIATDKIVTNGTILVAIDVAGKAMVSTDKGTSWQIPATAPTSGTYLAWSGTEFLIYDHSNTTLYSSTDGINWSNISTTGLVTATLDGIITFSGVHVLFGGNDIFTSNDISNGASFYTLDSSNVWQTGDFRDSNTNGTKFGESLNVIRSAIVTSANTLLVVGDGGVIAEQTGPSLPALGANSWSRRSGGSGSGLLYDIATNGSSYVAVSSDPAILYSTDGTNWSKATLPTYTAQSGLATQTYTINTSLERVEWTGSEYIAFDNGTAILTSSDGQNWMVERKPDSPASSVQGASHVFGGETIWYSKATSGTTNATVRDNTGSLRDVDVAAGASNTTIQEFANNGSLVVAVGNFGITTSSDLDTWTTADLSSITNSSSFLFDSVAWNGSKFIAIGYGASDALFMLQSSDGATWTSVDPVVDNLPVVSGLSKTALFANVLGITVPDLLHPLRLRAGNGKFVLLTNYSGVLVESTDGINWNYLFNRGINNQPTDYWSDYLNTGTKEILGGSRSLILTK